MTKPKSLRMRLHEMNRPPEYLQAYPAEEMDDYLCGLEADALADRLELSGAVSLLKTMKAENARLREALQQIADATLETWTSYCNVDGHHELVIKTMGDMPAIARAALGKE